RHDRELDRLDAVASELELVPEALREREEQARTDVIATAGQDLARAGHAADVRVLLEAEDVEPALGEQGRRREAVVPGADDDDVTIGHRSPCRRGPARSAPGALARRGREPSRS